MQNRPVVSAVAVEADENEMKKCVGHHRESSNPLQEVQEEIRYRTCDAVALQNNSVEICRIASRVMSTMRCDTMQSSVFEQLKIICPNKNYEDFCKI